MVVTASGYAFFFIAMKKKTDGAGELFAKIEELSGKNAKLSASVGALREEAERVEKLKSSFIKESGIVTFAKSLEALGVQSEATLTIESLEPGLGDANTPVLNFRIKAAGRFGEVMRVVALLENLPAKLEWKTVRILRENDALQGSVREPKWLLDVAVVATNFVNE